VTAAWNRSFVGKTCGELNMPASKPDGPDFSAIDSQVKAEGLFRKGDLEKVYLFPLEFGGEDVALNILYVPIGVADIKSGIDKNVIGALAAEGKITQYKAEPEYQGKSFIPIALKITAWDPGHFTTTINIWGDALGRDEAG
jgi:hypothetical protein